MNVRELFQYGKDYLAEAEILDAATDAWELLSYLTGLTRTRYLLEENEEAETQTVETYKALLARRATHIPLQYITGTQEFMGLPFRVSSDVLIPRQDTETLVEHVGRNLHSGDRILDICTGSGCILISLLCNYPKCSGTGVDLSKSALAIARENAKTNGVEAEWICSDLYENVSGSYDVIVSNPPYIATDVIKVLSPEVRDHEPRMALDGSTDGLAFYRRIIPQALHYLTPGGRLCLEIGFDQGEEVSQMMWDEGFVDVDVIQDYGGNDRVVSGHL